jgi:hypothetical protein
LAVSPPQLDAVGAVDVLAVLGVQQRRPVEVAGVSLGGSSPRR